MNGVKTVFVALGLAWCASGLAAQSLPEDAQVSALHRIYEAQFAQRPALPDLMLEALIASEDRNFKTRAPEFSTLTRLVAVILSDGQANREALSELSVTIAKAFDRGEILRILGHGGYFGLNCYGIEAAALAYFDKQPGQLEPGEIAFMAGLLKAPNRLHPQENPTGALERRDFTLREMVKTGALTLGQAQVALASPLGTREPIGECAGN